MLGSDGGDVSEVVSQQHVRDQNIFFLPLEHVMWVVGSRLMFLITFGSS